MILGKCLSNGAERDSSWQNTEAWSAGRADSYVDT